MEDNHALIDQERLNEVPPVIIVGMHRSGTSLLASLLDDLGIFMGRWLSRDAEAIFFQKINRRIYREQGANWAEPGNLISSVVSPEFISEQVNTVRKIMIGRGASLGFPPAFSRHFGRQEWMDFISRENYHWGWKDPRTALLIPLWAEIFPKAKWIHIYRNGIDVAISLYLRTLRQRRKLLRHIYRFDYYESTLDFSHCFELWEIYLASILDAISDIDQNRCVQIQYEQLLASPVDELKKLLDFLDYSPGDDVISRVSQQIDPANLDTSQRKKRFKEQILLLPNSQRMVQLGYSGEIYGPEKVA